MLDLRRLASLVSISILLMQGCIAPARVDPAELAAVAEENPSVVVALVDSGINPYHEAFRAPALDLPDRVLAAGPVWVQLASASTWDDAVAADERFWTGLQSGTLYWFEGTRVLAMALSDPTESPGILDEIQHGTGAAAAILAQNPNALIVMIETDSGRKDLPPFFDPAYVVSGIAWASAQPWIDVISLSLGMPLGAPIDGLAPIPQATKQAVASGKVVVAGTGNDATPSFTNQIGGPPWVVKAGGAWAEQRGETTLASKAPDFVSNFSGMYPCARSLTESCEYIGTSFSTPLVAGAFARAIHELRAMNAHEGGIKDGALVHTPSLRVTNHDLREAFNRTAQYWSITDYQPQAPPLDRDPIALPFRTATPITPTPWLQMGWGYVGPDAWRDAVDVILGASDTTKPPEATTYMQQLDAARHAYWEQQP